MALIIKSRVLETSTTTGTGAFTLAGAVTGYRRFSAVCSTNDTAYYCIEAVDANGNPSGDWETGLGTYSSANTLTRTSVHESTNSNNAVNFAAGTKRVSLNATATHLSNLQPLDSDLTAIAGLSGVQGDVIYRDGTQWQRLAAGTSGQFLKTQGAAANPVWASDTTPSWSLAGAGQTATGIYDQAVDGSKANVDFTGLGSYNELLIFARNLTCGTSGVRGIRLSVDNGSTFFSTSGNYSSMLTTGVESATDSFAFHDTATTAARTFVCHVLNLKGSTKACVVNQTSALHIFTASASDVNAIRVYNSGGGNLTGGTVYVYAR